MRQQSVTLTPEMATAIDYIENSAMPVYITGKAGTGKTTLLKYMRETVHMNIAVTAPTGIAALNAGGQTLHSFFMIPLGVLDPEHGEVSRLRMEKIKMLQKLELLVIDEVSMVRPDVMDYIDRALRKYRHNKIPFGGVKIAMFGDLYQLPPVVRSTEEEAVYKFYAGPFFFNARVFRDTPIKVVELTKIFRQNDPRFIEILNNLRVYNLSDEDLDDLAALRDPARAKSFENNSIHVCSLRREADAINFGMLGQPQSVYGALFEGKTTAQNVPCDVDLKLRVGARVMTLVNNREDGYVNGTLGTVAGFGGTEAKPLVYVDLDNGERVSVGRYVWEQQEFVLDGDKVESRTIGRCTQFPLTLAWAITIHKSQGLTFDRVSIHSKCTFDPGQLYVALSRATSMNGVVTDSFITRKQIIPDKRLLDFENAYKSNSYIYRQQ